MDNTEFLITLPEKEQPNTDINIGLPEVLPEILMTPNICVIGVGGAGGNAVNNMIAAGLTGVRFVVANTDAQVMARSLTHERIQLGAALTQGLGAGSDPAIGKAAAEESAEKIKETLKGVNLLFIAAGMGGGTGTGASPVIAKIAKEMGILTIGFVTKPFLIEHRKRMRIAEAGIEELSKYVDTYITIPNQNLFLISGPKTSIEEAFKMADDVLYQGIKSITDTMLTTMTVHVDFADFRAITKNKGKAIMGSGEASGENRAKEAIEMAVTNPLLDVSIKGAKGVLISFSGKEISLPEMEEATQRIQQEVDEDADIFLGVCSDENAGDKLRISIVATGLEHNKEVKAPQTMRLMVEEQEPIIITPQKSEEKPAENTAEEEKQSAIFVPAPHERETSAQESQEEQKTYQAPVEESFVPEAPVEPVFDEEELEKQSEQAPDLFSPLLDSFKDEEEAEEKITPASTQAQPKEKRRSFFGGALFPDFLGEKNLIERSKKRLQKEEPAQRTIPQLPDEDKINIPAFFSMNDKK